MAGRFARRLRLIRRIQARNLVGAVLAFLYFRVIDPSSSDPGVTWGDIAFFVCAMTLLIGFGIALGLRLNAPLMHPERHDPREVRRVALAFPYVMTAIAALGWILAGVIFGVLWPWMTGILSLRGAVRNVFGVTVIGGGVTAAFVFLSAERFWRDELRTFFPEGDLAAVTGVPRLRVRIRLLAVFVLTSVVRR